MPQTMIGRGNELYDWIVDPPTITWSGSVGATSTAEITFQLPGLILGDVIAGVSYATGAMTTGLSPTNWRISAANTVAVTWANTTAGALTPPTAGWVFELVRPENPNNLPPTAA